MFFRQYFDRTSCTYTYFVADGKDALVIDPVLEMLERDLKIIEELGLNLKYVLETHVHADHISSAKSLKEKTGAKLLWGSTAGVEAADKELEDGEVLELGSLKVKTIHTPGHTNGCTSYSIGNKLFTGDALLIRGCGRTDFQEGSPQTLFQSVREKLFALPDDTEVYPGHDYNGRLVSSIGEEKAHNARLKLSNSLEDFISIMENLNLAHPKMIDIAVPANLKGGQ